MTINGIITEMSFKYEKSNIHENVVIEELQLDESCSINSMDLFETYWNYPNTVDQSSQYQ